MKTTNENLFSFVTGKLNNSIYGIALSIPLDSHEQKDEHKSTHYLSYPFYSLLFSPAQFY